MSSIASCPNGTTEPFLPSGKSGSYFGPVPKDRIGLIADDLLNHFDLRLEAMEGKALIVCMSRRICVDAYNAITKLRPDWHDEDDAKGAIKVVMTGSASDELEW